MYNGCDDLEIFDFFENGIPKKVHERSNYFDELDNLTIFRRFGLTKPTVFKILDPIEEQLEYPDDR